MRVRQSGAQSGALRAQGSGKQCECRTEGSARGGDSTPSYSPVQTSHPVSRERRVSPASHPFSQPQSLHSLPSPGSVLTCWPAPLPPQLCRAPGQP